MVKLIHIILVFFFFFQAEDGIRDKLVTGVQTCALPIWIGSWPLRTRWWAQIAVASWAVRWRAFRRLAAREPSEVSGSVMPSIATETWRSEERRVGKECRSRWSPYH